MSVGFKGVVRGSLCLEMGFRDSGFVKLIVVHKSVWGSLGSNRGIQVGRGAIG